MWSKIPQINGVWFWTLAHTKIKQHCISEIVILAKYKEVLDTKLIDHTWEKHLIQRINCGFVVSDMIMEGKSPTHHAVYSLRPRQNGRHFADDIFKCIFLNENVWIPIKISLKFVPKGPINDIPALVQIMAWRRPGDKPLSEPKLVRLSTHICVTRPQWVNALRDVFWEMWLWF